MLNEQIKKRRLALGLSQTQLAVLVSELEGLAQPLSYTTVQQWEKPNGTAPKHKRLQHVAAALKTSVPELLGAADSPADPAPASRWPLHSISAEELAALPSAKLEQIDNVVAALIGAEPPPDWQATARALAADLAENHGKTELALFISIVDKAHFEKKMTHRLRQQEARDASEAATQNPKTTAKAP